MSSLPTCNIQTFLSMDYFVVVVEILFCIADQTGNAAQYYDGDKVTAESQGYNKQASTKERKTQTTQTANTQKEKEKGRKKEICNLKMSNTVERVILAT